MIKPYAVKLQPFEEGRKACLASVKGLYAAHLSLLSNQACKLSWVEPNRVKKAYWADSSCRLHSSPMRHQLEDQEQAIAYEHEHTLKPAEGQLCFEIHNNSSGTADECG